MSDASANVELSAQAAGTGVPANHQAEALAALCKVLLGAGTLLRSASQGIAPNHELNRDPLQWLERGAAEYRALLEADDNGPLPSAEPVNSAAVELLAETVEFLAVSIEELANGADLADDGVVHATFAAAKFSEFMRLVPRPEYERAMMRIWDWERPKRGRKAAH